jgi:mannose-6-phosphate isomerase
MCPPAPKEPLFFKRIAKPTVWGGRRLAEMLGFDATAAVNPDAPASANANADAAPIGETWELSDYPGMETTVRGGQFDGASLQQLLSDFPDDLLGESRPDPNGRFPLLVKFIDADADLSVQIHPPDGELSPTGVGKTEAWFILDAVRQSADQDDKNTDANPERRGSVIAGLKAPANRLQLEADAASSKVLDHLQETEVNAGDCLMIEAGTTHAIRSGVLLCEVQQTSDVTYRMYDWDRVGMDGKPRTTHVAEALAVVDYDASAPKATRAEFPAVADDAVQPVVQVASLANCDYFRLHLVRVHAEADHHPHGFARILCVLKGNGVIHSEAGGERDLQLGDVVLIPARMGEFVVHPGVDGLELLEAVAL